MLNKDQKLKDALTMLCYACALGAFGAFFRWLQMQTARDAQTGLMNRSVLNYIVPLLMIAAAVILYRRTKRLTDDKTAFPTDMYAALSCTSVAYVILAWVVAALYILGGILTISALALDSQRGLYVIIAILAVASGLGFPLICTATKRHYSPSLIAVFMTLPVIMFCLWLIACYRTNASNPNIWLYAVEILSVCAVILALLYVAGYAYGRAEPRKACFMVLFGAFMCITSLADSRAAGPELIMLATAGELLIYGWLFVKNRADAPEPEAEIEDGGEDDKKPDEDISGDGVAIEPSEDITIPEPTIQAPARMKKPDEVDKIIKEYKDK